MYGKDEDYEAMIEEGLTESLIKSMLKRLQFGRAPIKSFSEYGPTHITPVDWNDSNQRARALACLVQGVYTSEKERQRGIICGNPESKAKPWWESFNFTLNKELKDPDGVIYGAVFDNNDYRNTPGHLKPPPRQVIAFRGTLLKRRSWLPDLYLDLRAFFGSLHKSNRFTNATEVIQSAVEKTGNIADVWVVGHSLGAALALLTGKNMARSGYPLESHLFNPPFLSIPIEMLVDSKLLKHGVRFVGSLIKAGVAKVVQDENHHHEDQEDHSCMRLASWTPYLYLNRSDWFSSEYIGYFEHRDNMSKIGAENIEKIATKHSLMSVLIKIYRKLEGGGSSSQDSSSEPIHVLPSAYLTINTHKSPDFKRAHGIRQWWDPMCNGEFVLYQFNE